MDGSRRDEDARVNASFDEVPLLTGLPALRSTGASWLRRILIVDLSLWPPLHWVPAYSWATFRTDLLSAAVGSTLLVPQSLAYAVLAGVPAEYGLYSSIVPLFVYSMFTSSSQVAPGPNAPSAILMQGLVAQLTTAPVMSPDFARVLICLSALSGVCGLLLSALRVGGFIANLLSWPVMAGFSSGAALTILVSQLPDFTGVVQPKGTTSNCFTRLAGWVAGIQVQGVNWRATSLALCMLLVLLFAKRVRFVCCRRTWALHKQTPVAFLVAIASILGSWAGGLEDGASPNGLVDMGAG